MKRKVRILLDLIQPLIQKRQNQKIRQQLMIQIEETIRIMVDLQTMPTSPQTLRRVTIRDIILFNFVLLLVFIFMSVEIKVV